MTALPAERLLRTHRLRATAVRRAVMEAFLETEHALTHRDIEATLEGQFDRVTLYRTLHAFADCGLLHKVPDEEKAARFALTVAIDTQDAESQHLHFKCEACNQVFCLPESEVPSLQVPAGYSVRQVKLLVLGTCRDCEATASPKHSPGKLSS